MFVVEKTINRIDNEDNAAKVTQIVLRRKYHNKNKASLQQAARIEYLLQKKARIITGGISNCLW
jgi:hypothetical protein